MAAPTLDDQLADEAERQLGELKNRCKAEAYSDASREALWQAFREWTAHPLFSQYPGMLRCTVLNELTFCQNVDELVGEAWGMIGDLAERWDRNSLGTLMESIRISTFECIAEAPEQPEALQRLFSMAADKHRRWAVFAAYENVPWRLRTHAMKYSKGLVTEDDCDAWLRDQFHGDDEILMARLS